jgi:hypothetical protein
VDRIANEIALDELPERIEQILAGSAAGRTIVALR